MTRLPFKLERNFRFSLARWVFSMTKMMSAHSICSDDNGTLAPLEMPAESVSIPGQVEKDLFGGWAAQAISAADEEDVGHVVTRMGRRRTMSKTYQ
jgi:hypothetical protein